ALVTCHACSSGPVSGLSRATTPLNPLTASSGHLRAPGAGAPGARAWSECLLLLGQLGLERLGVLLDPGVDGLGFLALAVLVDDHVLGRAVLLVVELDALDEVGRLGELVRETLGTQEVQGLGLTEGTLGVLQVPHREGAVGPERAPQGDDD